MEAAERADKVVVAWGEFGATYHQRVDDVLKLLIAHAQPLALPLQCLGKTQNGCPRHPLYLARSTPLVPYDHQETRASANIMIDSLKQAFDYAAQQPEAIQASIAALIMKALDQNGADSQDT
ncbi:MAG: DUF1643 domain-containing protein [Ktedonobacterales bacterium]